MDTKNYIFHLKEILKKTGWSQTRLAHEVGVTFAALNRWLQGHAKPQPTKQIKLVQIYREFVGLKPMAPSAYRNLLKRAKKLKNKKMNQILSTSHQALADELIVNSTYNSNTIEGTKLTYRETEVLIFSHIFAAGKPFEDNIVSLNHASIVRDIFRGEYHGSLTEEMIREMHRRLFQGIRDDAGHYSKHQRIIGGLNIQLTHPADIPEEMANFIKQVNRSSTKKEVIEFIAETHARFELIHPFGDGNGRIGRLIIIKQCLQNNYPPIIVENARKAEYYEVLEEAQRRRTHHLTELFVEEMERINQIIKKAKT